MIYHIYIYIIDTVSVGSSSSMFKLHIPCSLPTGSLTLPVYPNRMPKAVAGGIWCPKLLQQCFEARIHLATVSAHSIPSCPQLHGGPCLLFTIPNLRGEHRFSKKLCLTWDHMILGIIQYGIIWLRLWLRRQNRMGLSENSLPENKSVMLCHHFPYI